MTGFRLPVPTGANTLQLKADEIVNARTVLVEGDILVVYGHKNDIKK